MTEYRSGGGLPSGRVGLVVAQFNEAVTSGLLKGARTCLREQGVSEDSIDVVWVPGTFELPAVADALAKTERYRALVALAAVVRGETAHFDFIASSVSHALQEVAVRRGIGLGFGVLTTDTMAQAVARAGGAHGNKGYEAAQAALDVGSLIEQFRDPPS